MCYRVESQDCTFTQDRHSKEAGMEVQSSGRKAARITAVDTGGGSLAAARTPCSLSVPGGSSAENETGPSKRAVCVAFRAQDPATGGLESQAGSGERQHALKAGQGGKTTPQLTCFYFLRKLWS